MAFHPEKLLLHLPHLMITTIFLFLIIPCASLLSFNFTDFSQINNGTITMAGNATISDSLIQLTPNAVDNWGRATYSETMHLWEKSSGKVANFTTSYSFIISSEGADRYSDGLTFFLASPNFPPPFPTDGSGLGLVSRDQMRDSSFLASNKFVFVEFDTYPNVRWDPPEPVREHVGININNLTSQKSTTWYSVIKENRTYSCSISYDPSAQNFSVSFTGFSSNDHIPIEQHLSSIVDLREYLPERVEFGFSAGTGLISELHIISSWSFESTAPLMIIQKSPQPQPNKTENESKGGLIVGLSVGASACLLIIGLGLFWLMKRKKNRDRGEGDQDLAFDLSMDNEFERGTGPKKFSYKELVRTTNNFAEENKLGQGWFGGVYKGFLREMNLYVAIKRVSRGSRQGIKEYASEVKSISRLRHKNPVQLIGWCHENKDLLLIYEFMSNGSLDSHLFKGKSLLTWVTRYNIAQGLASALLYLHEEWEQFVLHRDIKSSNIMLDSSFNAKLGDFGLARMVEHAKGSQTTALAGTMGYLAPECVISGRTSKESDIYSFGIVTLEIACGRKAIETKAKEDEIILLEWVWELYGRGKLLDAADAKLCGEFDEQQMERLMIVGLWCGHPDYSLRPSIRKALHVLDFEAPLPIDLAPKMPVPTYVAPSGRASTSTTTTSSTASSSASALLYSLPVN
ncbi:L-type lectin-domain containing receptor kinase IX.1-like [Corylus avellana]|uniref:L-type lectin-domain containing receptor kinase IX.1-like n=1 Tax=Corylus avellana TaxID=13451 RepID=UPI00286CF0AE|nr:L-type lectin-domain containing receptor kinase IX.1-like [Corylus avellana]